MVFVVGIIVAGGSPGWIGNGREGLMVGDEGPYSVGAGRVLSSRATGIRFGFGAVVGIRWLGYGRGGGSEGAAR